MADQNRTVPQVNADGMSRLQAIDPSVDGVMGGRVMAWIVDFLIVSVLTWIVFTALGILGFLTFGLTWLLIPLCAVGTLLAYAAITIGGAKQATIGMRMAGLKVERAVGGAPDGLSAAVHALLFYVAAGTIGLWIATVAIGFLRSDKRMGHDLLTGLVVVRA